MLLLVYSLCRGVFVFVLKSCADVNNNDSPSAPYPPTIVAAAVQQQTSANINSGVAVWERTAERTCSGVQ